MSRVVRSMARTVSATVAIVLSENRHDPTTAAAKSFALAKSEVSAALVGNDRLGWSASKDIRRVTGDVSVSVTASDHGEPELHPLDADYAQQARRSMDLSWQIVNSEDGWTKEAGDDEESGVVFSKRDPRFGKVFKLVANVDVNAEVLFNDTVENAEQSVQWNPTVIHVRVLQRSKFQRADVCYAVSGKGAGGLVASRDFVYVRHWAKRDGWYATSCQSIDYRHQLPVDDEDTRRVLKEAGGMVRGINGPSCMRFRPLSPGKCRIEWLCNTNIQGWLPQWLTDQALSGAQLSFLAALRKHSFKLAGKSG